MLRLIFCLLLTATLAVPQPGNYRYQVSAATTALTVQQPASNANQVQFQWASIYCSAASTATPSWNGTAATATAATIKRIPGTTATPRATAWSGSNVGAGTTGWVANIPAGATMAFDLTTFFMGTTGTATNLTYTTSNSCTITFEWTEK